MIRSGFGRKTSTVYSTCNL